MNKRNLQIMTILLFSFYLIGCTFLVPPIAEVNNTSTPTLVVPTATETASPTPTETATPEAKFKENPEIENYEAEVINYEDLFNNKYKEWLESLEPTHFDPNNIIDVPLVQHDNGKVFHSVKNAPHWEGANAGKEPFNRNRTFAYCTYQGNEYIVMPVEYYDRNHPDKNQWLITVMNITGRSDAQVQEYIAIWKNDMNTNLWTDSEIDPWTGTTDPLVALTVAEYPNLKDLVGKFVDININRNDGKGDRTVLDLPGIVVPNYAVQGFVWAQ